MSTSPNKAEIKILNDRFQAIRQMVDLRAVVSPYVTLRSDASDSGLFTGACPFCPAAGLFTVKHTVFYCHTCAAGGDAVAFLMRINRVSLEQAVSTLEEIVDRGSTSLNMDDPRIKALVQRIVAETLREVAGWTPAKKDMEHMAGDAVCQEEYLLMADEVERDPAEWGVCPLCDEVDNGGCVLGPVWNGVISP